MHRHHRVLAAVDLDSDSVSPPPHATPSHDLENRTEIGHLAMLRNLFEYYCYDMSEWFELDTGADGTFAHNTSSVWAKGCHVYLAKAGASIAGFAIVGSGTEWLGDSGVHDVHEFFIMRKFRRRGIGQSMTTFLWDEHPGEWLVRVLAANAPAVLFWRKVISRYSLGSFQEEQRIVSGRPWKFFRFASTVSPAV